MDDSIFFAEEHPASPSAWRDCARDWLTRAETSPSPIWQSLTAIVPTGSFGKMSPASCRQTEDGILEPFSGRWGSSGMGSHGACLTLNMCEWTGTGGQFPSAGGVCSLSDILETGDRLQPYFLSPKACAGILRRADKRGKDLPPMLARALSAAAEESSRQEKRAGKIRSSRLAPRSAQEAIEQEAIDRQEPM